MLGVSQSRQQHQLNKFITHNKNNSNAAVKISATDYKPHNPEAFEKHTNCWQTRQRGKQKKNNKNKQLDWWLHTNSSPHIHTYIQTYWQPCLISTLCRLPSAKPSLYSRPLCQWGYTSGTPLITLSEFLCNSDKTVVLLNNSRCPSAPISVFIWPVKNPAASQRYCLWTFVCCVCFSCSLCNSDKAFQPACNICTYCNNRTFLFIRPPLYAPPFCTENIPTIYSLNCSLHSHRATLIAPTVNRLHFNLSANIIAKPPSEVSQWAKPLQLSAV